MEQNKSFSSSLQRITVIDALRGFALLGVILTHMWQHYGIFSFSGMDLGEPLFPKLDESLRWLLQNAIMGRFINIFAFLFGLSFFIQMDRASKKGIDFRKRFLWRMVILFIIGIIGNCFYTGDILSIYAVFGVLMVFLYKCKNWVLIAIITLLLIGLPRILTTSYNQMVKVEQTTNSGSAQTSENRPAVRPQASNTEKPSFLNSAKNNLTRGLEGKLNYQFGLFILGLIIGRMRFFEQVEIQKKRNFILFAGFVLAVIVVNWIVGLFPPQDIRMLMRSGADISPALLAVMALENISTVLFSGALVMGFIILYQIKGIGKCLSVMTPYGRMGLTNYEMQSVIGCLIFSMWALGSIFGSWGITELFALGLAIYAMQVIFSKYWLKHFLYGPLEWLWRSATYLKLQPFRRK
jgi:uncharacterized protein